MSLWCSKHPYPSKRDAVTACHALTGNGTRFTSRRKRRRLHRPEFLRAYVCDRCGMWHITHQREEDRA